jgi:hypothetical protein
VDEKEREDFYDRNRRKDQASVQWRERNQEYLGYYVDYISRLQSRRILHYELIFSVVSLGLIVNLASSVILEIQKSFHNQNWSLLESSTLELLIMIAIGYVIVLLFDKRMKEYDPNPRSLYLPITLIDCSNYRDEETYDHIYNYLNSKKMTEFKEYSQRFFRTLENWYSHLFHPIVPQMISEYFEYDDIDFNKVFPITKRAYDITELTTSGIKLTLEVILRPQIIYSFGEGKQPHIRGIDIDLKVDVGNPMDSQADDLIIELYWRRLGRIPEYVSIAIERAFYPLIDEINPAKIREKVMAEYRKRKSG